MLSLTQTFNKSYQQTTSKRRFKELFSKDVSNFDAKNPIIGSLIREIDISKKDVLSKLLANTPTFT